MPNTTFSLINIPLYITLLSIGRPKTMLASIGTEVVSFNLRIGRGLLCVYHNSVDLAFLFLFKTLKICKLILSCLCLSHRQ